MLVWPSPFAIEQAHMADDTFISAFKVRIEDQIPALILHPLVLRRDAALQSPPELPSDLNAFFGAGAYRRIRWNGQGYLPLSLANAMSGAR